MIQMTISNKKEEKRISIEEFIESPYAKIGMFTKLVLNHFVFQEKLKKFLNRVSNL